MSSSNMFWRSVEAISWGARDVALREHLGETYAQIQPYLMPAETLTYQLGCERTKFGHACRYRVVEDPMPDGRYAAVCDEHRCPTKYYTRAELVRYTINPQILGPAVARCLGLHPQVEALSRHLLRIGQIAASPKPIPVIFTRANASGTIVQELKELILRGFGKFVLVLSSRKFLDQAVQELLDRWEASAFALDEATEMDGSSFDLTDAGEVTWQKLQEHMGGPALRGAVFPTPAGAAWHDLTLVFRDGHTLTATLGKVRGSYSYQDMGMDDRRKKAPDAQWALLYHFAEEMGIFTWSSQNADARNKKRKERLAARLRVFFGIEGEPFVYRKDDGGWEAVFNVRTER